MSAVVSKVVKEIRETIINAMGRAVAENSLPSEPIPDFSVEVPADRSHGDYATNAAMVSAKVFHMPPRKIAEIIIKNVHTDGTYIEDCKIAGPGFINFTLKPVFYADVVTDVLSCAENYGSSGYGQGKKVLVEFVSANPTGPMHIGNARGGALGDCLSAVLSVAGYDVTKEFYVNDAGNQIEKFGLSLEARYMQIFLGEDKVEFPEDGYHGEDIKKRASEFADIHADEYVNSESEPRRKALIDYALNENVKALKEDLKRYRIEYDEWFFESTLYKNGELDETIQLLKQRGLTYEKDGALWYKATDFGSVKDEVLVRANGHPTYFAADIAYHRNKFLKRGFDKCINVWGADHHGHVARLKGAMDAIGLDGKKLDIVLMQLVKLVRDGETVKVSKRTGKAITLADLLEEVPIDAARFFFNMREPGSQMNFDLDLAIEQSSNNPVYYVQYAYARICSIIKNLAAENIKARPCSSRELQLLSSPEEKELISFISRYTQEIIESSKLYNPASITRYSIDLANLFHKFYNACRVKGNDEPLMQARLNLCIATRQVIKNILDMFNVTAPEIM